MGAQRGTKIREHAVIAYPDGTINDGSIWQLPNGLVYAEVDEMWYAIDFSIEDDVSNHWRLKNDRNGMPVLQGLPPEDNNT